MGFENCEVGFAKKMNWEMGLVPLPLPLQDLIYSIEHISEIMLTSFH